MKTMLKLSLLSLAIAGGNCYADGEVAVEASEAVAQVVEMGTYLDRHTGHRCVVLGMATATTYEAKGPIAPGERVDLPVANVLKVVRIVFVNEDGLYSKEFLMPLDEFNSIMEVDEKQAPRFVKLEEDKVLEVETPAEE